MTSRLADFADAHGRALILIFLSFALAGLVFSFRLPIALFPQTDFPRIIILVDNGIAPVDVQTLTVTRPVEEAIRSVPGITDVRSITGRGSSEISVMFRWDVDILHALHLVQGKIAQIMPTLPQDARFYTNRLTFSVFPMIGFSVISPKRSTAELYDLAYYELAPRLYRLPGVAETRIVGGRQPEYHVLVEPEKLNSYGIPLTKVADAIRKTNLIGSAGMLQENYKLYLTTVTGLLENKEQIEDVVVDVVKGTPVYVKNVARVVDGERPVYNIVTANGLPAVLVNVLQQPDGNAVEIADAVNRELQEIRKTLPPDIQLNIFYDQSINVRDSIGSVTESILIGLALSIAVLLGFLKNWRTTLVAALVIPIAALTGSTLTPIVVFVPLVFLGGITAVFFRALALTLVTALLASLFLAIFFTPVLARAFFKRHEGPAETEIERAEQAGEGRILRGLTARYEKALRWSLRHTRVTLLAALLVVVAMVVLLFNLGRGFLPEMDEGAFVLDYIMPSGTSLEETHRVLSHIEKMLKETPEVESYSLRVGARLALAIAEPNTGDFLIKLKRK